MNCSQPNKENVVWPIQLRYIHTTGALVEEWRRALKPILLQGLQALQPLWKVTPVLSCIELC